jgi:hypothetical protein
MSVFFDRQRRVIFSATLALSLMGGLATYLDRNNFQGWKPNDWIGAELLGLLLAVCAVLAGWAKPRWLQWVGVGACSFKTCGFLFSIPSVPKRHPMSNRNFFAERKRRKVYKAAVVSA